MVIYFSQDIIFEILVKVPAKDLLRAKVVCKLWHSIISDPNFVNSQLAHSRSQPAEIILKLYSAELGDDYFEMFTITTQKHGIMQVEKICDMNFPPLQFPFTESTVKASCNGLLLIFHGKYPFETLYVYNPVTRQYVALPSMIVPLDMNCNPPRCYYSWTLFYNDSVGKYVVFGRFHSRCIVLTVGDKEWSRYQNPYSFSPYLASQLIYVEKKVHWLKSETENGQVFCRINPLKCFHVSVNIGATMEFTRTILPDHPCNGFHTLFEVKGSLCFASQKRYLLQIFVFEKREGNTTWNKCYSTHLESLSNLPQPIRRLNSYIFVGTRGDIDSRTTDYSDVVKIVMQHEDKLFYYDLKRIEYKNIAHKNNEVTLRIADINNQVKLDIYPLFYASSLVKPEQDILIA